MSNVNKKKNESKPIKIEFKRNKKTKVIREGIKVNYQGDICLVKSILWPEKIKLKYLEKDKTETITKEGLIDNVE